MDHIQAIKLGLITGHEVFSLTLAMIFSAVLERMLQDRTAQAVGRAQAVIGIIIRETGGSIGLNLGDSQSKFPSVVMGNHLRNQREQGQPFWKLL